MQVIPHINDEIKLRMRLAGFEEPRPDVIIPSRRHGRRHRIAAVPGAARQLRHELGRDSVFFVHVSLVPFMGA